MSLWKKIESKIDTPVWLEWLFGVVFLLRIPSFFEPFFYGDEMIYLTLGNGVRQGLTLYKHVHDNKPPLLYLIAAVSGNVFWFKVILAFWSLATIYIFWKLVRHLFTNNKRLQIISTWIFAIFTTIPILEGNIANSELFFIGPIIAAFYLLLSKQDSEGNIKTKYLLTSGVLFSIAALFKIPAAFDIPAILIFWVLTTKLNKQNLLRIAKNFSIVVLGFLIPILITFVWYWFRGALSEYFIAAFMQNVGYLSSFRPSDVQKPFLVRNLPLLIRAGVVLLGLIVLFIRRNKLSKQFLFLSVWLLLTLFAVTLSERPYPHYLLQSIASISILVGMFVAAKSIEQLYTIIPLTLVFLVPVVYKFYYYTPIYYYQRFFQFATKQIDKEKYYNSFDKNTSRNYKIGEFLMNSSTTKDRVFVWGDSASIYAISRRMPPIKYVANYHINDFSSKDEVISALQNTPPKFIVTTQEGESFPQLEKFISEKYLLVEVVENSAEIWVRKSQ